jgi:hypothetical protein
LRRLQCEIGREAGEHSDREHVAVGELDHVEHAEEQREAHGDQAVHDPEHEPVDQILKRDLHAVISEM